MRQSGVCPFPVPTSVVMKNPRSAGMWKNWALPGAAIERVVLLCRSQMIELLPPTLTNT